MKKYIAIVFLILLFSCGNDSPYPGFKRGKHGIYYQLHKIGESSKKARYGDYITSDIIYKTMKDSMFFHGRRKLQLVKQHGRGSIEECFKMLTVDDSATFIISADEFFTKTLETSLPEFIPAMSKMKVSLNIIEIQTQTEYQNEKKAFLNWIEDFGEYEKVILKQFLMEEKIDVQPSGSGLYYLKITEGKFFDSTIKRNQPFQFVYGTEWQVVEGLEEAIGMMKEGEKSLFILPSDLAFGTEGSSTGIIPPFTSLIFEVEVLSVN